MTKMNLLLLVGVPVGALSQSMFAMIAPGQLSLLVGVPVGALVWIAFRRGWIFPGSRFQAAGKFLPASAPAPVRVARLVEAAVLGIVGGILVLIMAPRSGFYDHSILNVVLFGCELAVVGLAILVVLSGRTKAGAILMGLMLLGYGMVLNNLPQANNRFPPEQMFVPLVNTIDLNGAHVTGADLWVNGVYLGKTPYTATLRDFQAKVPYWPKLPATYEKEKVETVSYGPRGSNPGICDRWIPFSLFVGDSLNDPMAKTRKPGVPGRNNTATYYAKVRYAGEWGWYQGRSNGYGSSEDYQISIEVIFRERQKRLDTLLNMARLAQYRVGPAWFQAAETYNGDVWLALGNGIEREPQMAEVRDAWASWRYVLDKVNDADSAWAAFQEICYEADTQQQYSTDSVAGRAVELLVPKLPQELLVSKAVQLIRDWSVPGRASWHNNGRLQFGCPRSPQFPASGFAVAHAVWMLDEQFRSTGEAEPNIIQQRIVPEIVRRHGKDFDPGIMLLASHLGGPALDKYLLRQKWEAPPDPANHYNDFTYASSRPVNKWLYCLAYLDDDAGRRNRQQHAHLFMDLADALCENNPIMWSNDIDFIFSDPGLAKDYWPRVFRLGPQSTNDQPLKTQWHYLAMMGDAATVEMFVEAWKGMRLSYIDYTFALGELDSLKPPLQRKVIDAIVRLVREDAGNLVDVLKTCGRNDRESKDRVIADLESHDRAGARLSEANLLWADLQKGPRTDQQSLRQNVPLWLAHTQPDSPLVAMLANADQPDLRLMVMGALQRYPIPRHQELLKKLLKDPDATVRAAAEKASGELQKLAARNPADFASGAASASSLPSAPATLEEKQ